MKVLNNGSLPAIHQNPSEGPAPSPREGVGWSRLYVCWVVFLIMCANILNYADRTILSVLAEAIKADLGLTDAEIGFLYGTSFVVTNAIASIILSHVADKWLRNLVMAIGVLFWSGMTALSGLANSFAYLAAARFGIGVGEAAIGPSAHSLVADIVPARFRAIAFAVNGVGFFIGMGVALGAGGWIVQNWGDHCGTLGLCGIRNWQVAFLLFGIPGILVAALLAMVREPEHGGMRARRTAARPLSEMWSEASFVLPPFSFFQIARIGGAGAVRRHAIISAAIIAAAAGLSIVTYDVMQWTCVAFAAYCLLSWVQSLALREPRLHRMTIGSTCFLALLFGTAIYASLTTAVSFWKVPLAIRNLGLDTQQAGTLMAGAITGGAFIGIMAGGALSDLGRRRLPSAPIYLAILGLLVSGLALLVLVTTSDVATFGVAAAFAAAASSLWGAGIPALVQDLILPDMRARTSALFGTSILTISLASGPYLAGRLADATGSIGTGLGLLYTLAPFSVILLAVAIRKLPRALALRAEMAGEMAPA